MEEALESVVSPILQRLTYDPDATWDWSEIARDGLLGVAIGGVLGGVGGSANERAAYRNAQQTPSVQQSTGVQPEVQQTQQSQTQQATQNNTAPYTQQEAARTDVIADYQRQEHHGNILDTVRENLPNLESMPSVHALTGKEFQRVSGDNRNLRTKVIDFFNSIGNKITRPGFGDIELNTAGTRDSLAHGYGKLKASAFAALPSILTKGRLISRRGPYPGHNYNSYIFAAPVDIGNERCYVGALVIQDDKTQRYKLHEVLATNKNGVSLFQSESDNTAAGPLRNDTPPGEPPGSPAFNVSIPQARTGVNTEYAQERQDNTTIPDIGAPPSRDMGAAIGGVLGGVGGSANESAAYRNMQQTQQAPQNNTASTGRAVVANTSSQVEDIEIEPSTRASSPNDSAVQSVNIDGSDISIPEATRYVNTQASPVYLKEGAPSEVIANELTNTPTPEASEPAPSIRGTTRNQELFLPAQQTSSTTSETNLDFLDDSFSDTTIPQAGTGVNTEYAHGQQKNTAPPNLTPQEAPAPTAGTPDMGTGTQRAETASAPEGMGAASLGFHPDAYVRWYEIFKTEEAEKGGTLSGAEVQEILNSSRALTQEQNPEP